MTKFTHPDQAGYRHVTRFGVTNPPTRVYHVLGGENHVGIITAILIRMNGATTYEVTWQDRGVSWAADAELSPDPVKAGFDDAERQT